MRAARRGGAAAGAWGRLVGCGQWFGVELSKSLRLGLQRLVSLAYLCTFVHTSVLATWMIIWSRSTGLALF